MKSFEVPKVRIPENICYSSSEVAKKFQWLLLAISEIGDFLERGDPWKVL